MRLQINSPRGETQLFWAQKRIWSSQSQKLLLIELTYALHRGGKNKGTPDKELTLEQYFPARMNTYAQPSKGAGCDPSKVTKR
jgi:hypothetical protein